MDLRLPWRRRSRELTPQEARQQRIDRRLRDIERQGAGSVLFAHGLAYLLVIAFSAGALITLAGDAINHFITQAQHGVFDFPSFVSFIVSFVLVFAMDTAMMIAAFHVRMLDQRQQKGAWKHMIVIVVVSLVESATYLDMGYLYDHPASWVTWAILGVRALLSPGIAVYLSLSRTLPVSTRDINTQVEVATGRGVLVDMTRIADDPHATTERKVSLYRASAIMDPADKARLDAIIEAERTTREGMTAPAPTPQPAPPLPRPSDEPLPAASSAASSAARALSNHELRRARLAEQMDTSIEEYDLPLDDEDDWARYAPPADDRAWDDKPLVRIGGHPTSPRNGHNGRASFSNHASATDGSSAAHIAPRGAELIVADPHWTDPLETLPASRYERATDSDQCRRVMRVLDQDNNATRGEIMRRAGVAEGTARKYIDRWNTLRSRSGRKKVGRRTAEMPVISHDMLSEATSK